MDDEPGNGDRENAGAKGLTLKQGGPLRAAVHLALPVALLIAAGSTSLAQAATVDASSTTLVGARPDWRDGQVHTIVPVISWVSVMARNIETSWLDDLRINISGWGAFESLGVYQPTSGGDMDVAFAQASLLHRRLTLRLGRQFLPQGAGRAQAFDGLNAEAMIWRGIGVTAYGGVPVVPRFAVASGDSVVGGRAFWRYSFDTELGASFIQVYDHRHVARRDVGADLRYAPRPWLAFTAFSLWSLVESRLAQAELSAQWLASSSVTLLGAVRRTAPDLLIPRTSIFSVFASDARTEGGGELTWEASRKASFTGSYFALWTGDGVGRDAGLSGTFHLTSKQRLGARVRVLSALSKGYVEGRIWFQHQFSPYLSGSVDLQSNWFDVAINGKRFASTATGNLVFAFAPQWTAVLSALGGVTPFFDSRLEGMAKVVFQLPDFRGDRQ